MGALSLEGAPSFLAGRAKVCRAELGTSENYKSVKDGSIKGLAQRQRGYDNPVKIGMLAAHDTQASKGSTQYPYAVTTRPHAPHI